MPQDILDAPQISLNQGQRKAADSLFQFLMSPQKEARISGPGGTGKTTLMLYLITTLMEEYENGCSLLGLPTTLDKVQLTATTNKAAEVLQKGTALPVRTIHSFMNLKVKDNYKTGRSEIYPTESWTVHGRTLIIVDEASMVDSTLYSYIQKGTAASCKIIYVGDRSQMAPVFEAVSPVYSQSGMPEFLLTEPVRNAGQPALQALCSQLRDTVETGVFKPIQPVPGVIDYVDGPQMQQLVNSTFSREDANSRILCYSNARVREFNEYTRRLRGYGSLFEPGEVLINNEAFAMGRDVLRAEQELRVVRRESGIREIGVDKFDPSAVMDVYDLLVQSGSYSFPVTVPANQKHYMELRRYYARQKQWAVFFKLKNSYPDLRPRDAATVYKAQGSTYESVFLDLSNIGKCTQPDQVARMLYVGVSRPTRRIYLYGQLPPRYTGG